MRILTICFLASIYAFGQDTVLREKKGESYYVLKDNPKVKHGVYQYTSKKGLVERGRYDNDKKIGVWEYYDLEGNLEQTYDYTLKQLIFNKDNKKFGGYKIITDGTQTEIVPDTPPVFIGGASRYQRFIANNLKYPEDSKSKGIGGRQFIDISLSSQGEILSASIHKSPMIPNDIGTEALRLIKELPKDWIPARYQNRDVSVAFIVSVDFWPK